MLHNLYEEHVETDYVFNICDNLLLHYLFGTYLSEHFEILFKGDPRGAT